MAMPPVPIFLLFLRRNPAKIAVRIAVIFIRPLVVIHHLVAVPFMVIAVVRVIYAVIVVM